jgi:uncharacterized membrane protein YbhN (UPF0104 family)
VTATSRLGRVGRAGFLVVALALLVAALVANRRAAGAAVQEVGLGHAGASLVAVLVALGASAATWRAVLAELGQPLPWGPALHVFFVGQLGKYVPGSVFAVAAQMELGRARGVPRSAVGTAALVSMGIGLVMTVLTAAAALALTNVEALRQFGWLLAVLPVGLVVLAPPVLTAVVDRLLRLLRRAPLAAPLTLRGVLHAAAWALLTAGAFGTHVWLLVVPQQTGGSVGVFLLSVGTTSLAWAAGFLFVIAPAGAGVRELALVVGLSPVLDTPAALAVAVLSRVLVTLGDLVCGAAALAPSLRADRAKA